MFPVVFVLTASGCIRLNQWLPFLPDVHVPARNALLNLHLHLVFSFSPPHPALPDPPGLQSLCCACCPRQCWLAGPASGPVRRPVPARRRRAAACCAIAAAWPSCPKSFRVRPLPSTWRRTGSSSCRSGPSVPCPRSSPSLWTTTTSLSSRQEPLRWAEPWPNSYYISGGSRIVQFACDNI